jgi:AraC-like DNA-binding protein
MTLDLPDELIVAAIDRAVSRFLMDDGVIERIADKLSDRFELLTPEQAAAVLGVSERTLTDRQAQWGLDKSLAFGVQQPRYFLSQILERARAKKLNGRSLKQPPTLKAVA